MRINSSGNVGIGSPNPQQSLQIDGITSLGPPGSVYGYMVPGASPGPYPTIGFNVYGTSYLAGASGYGGIFQFQDGDGKLIYYNAGNALAGLPHFTFPSFTIDNSGKVGIGTTTPTNGKLQVVGGSDTGVYGISSGIGGSGVKGESNSNLGVGVEGESSGVGDGYGVYGSGDGYGVYGNSTTGGIGVSGNSTGGTGVYGQSTSHVGVYGQSTSGPGLVANSDTGNLVEGYRVSVRKFHIDFNGSYVTGSDFAEALPALGDKAGYEPGDVLVLSTSVMGTVERTSRPCDERVAGVYSTRPGVLGAEKGGVTPVDADDLPVAIIGVVPTKVSAENGPIQVGDLLTTSSTLGHAMRCDDRVKCFGAILGKAMESLAEGTGVIKVLVTLR